MGMVKKIVLGFFLNILIFITAMMTIWAADKNQLIKNHEITIPHYEWSFKGSLGYFDNASVQRGYQVYRQKCASCHSINVMRYADLQQMGLTLEHIDKIAHRDQVMDGKDNQGQDYYRPANVTDYLKKPYFNDNIAKTANNGKIPPDFSRYMMIRKNGADYVMALLLGYKTAPSGFHFDNKASYYNLYAPHHQIGMKPPLTDGDIHYEDGTSATVEQQARDVVIFLNWAAHPHLTERHRMGIMLFLYMIFIVILVFLINRKVWSNVNK